MRHNLRILIKRQQLALKASHPKSRDRERRRLRVLQVCQLLGKKRRRVA